MKKTIILLIIFSGVCFIACSQNKTEIMQNPNITADNIVEELTKQVEHYPSEKIYAFSFSNERCFFELKIDDIPAYRRYREGSTAFEINRFIFKKGLHKIFYRILPIGKEEDTTYTTLVNETDLAMELNSYDLKNKGVDDIVYMKHIIPKIEEKVTDYYSNYKFEGTGKTSYEGSFEINLDIPYELHQPFENAQDLRKIDKKKLEVKLLKEYNKIRDVYQNKEKNNIAKLVYDNLKTQFVTNYSTKDKIIEAWNEINEILINSDIEILPIENYEMRFFGNGKLVALYTDDSNPKLRGGNALICHVKSGNHGKGFIELKHLFYIPQGETEFKVY